jgi:hypothetical protein
MTATWEIRAPNLVVYAAITDGALMTGDGPAPRTPDLVMTLASDELPTLQVLLASAQRGLFEIDGRPELLEMFARIFTPKHAG